MNQGRTETEPDAPELCPSCKADCVYNCHVEDDSTVPETHFKTCGVCGYEWGHE